MCRQSDEQKQELNDFFRFLPTRLTFAAFLSSRLADLLSLGLFPQSDFSFH